KNRPLVHSSSSAFSTAGVLPGHGPSSKVSTTSLGSRKSYCLKFSKPKPGPPVVSISTTRLTPSAFGLAQADVGATGGGAAGAGLFTEAVTSTSSLAASFAAAGGSDSLGLAAIVFGGAASTRGEEVQYQIPAIAVAAITVASIRPNALRIATLSANATRTGCATLALGH